MAEQITKNQHYVPQFLLNHFGYDVKKIKRINIFDMTRGAVRYNQSVKEVFCQNYFYDQDNSVEKRLRDYIETPVAGIINKLINEEYILLKENIPIIRKFISVQLVRTPKAREKAISFIKSSFDLVVEQLLSLNGYDTTDIGKLMLDESAIVSLITLMAIDDRFLVDLDFHLIKNDTTFDFCISDHPAFMYNWFYKDLEHPAITGLTARGLQIFLPLSPKLLICLYDSEVYKYGKKNLDITIVNSVDDIKILNSFQIINAESIIGFREKNSEFESGLKEIYRRSRKKRQLHQPESRIVKEENIGCDKLATHLTHTKQTKLSNMPSFITIKKKYKKDRLDFCERDYCLSALHQNYREQVLNSNLVAVPR